jgi:hypothetical protein
MVSEPVKVTVPEVGPEKSAASGWPTPPRPVRAQSTVAVPEGLVRVTVKVNAVMPPVPSAWTASVAAIAKVWPGSLVSV